MRALSGLGSPLESGADAASAMALRPRPGRAAEVIGEAGGGRRVCPGPGEPRVERSFPGWSRNRRRRPTALDVEPDGVSALARRAVLVGGGSAASPTPRSPPNTRPGVLRGAAPPRRLSATGRRLEDAALAARAFVADKEPTPPARPAARSTCGEAVTNRLGSSRSALYRVFPHGAGRYPDTGGATRIVMPSALRRRSRSSSRRLAFGPGSRSVRRAGAPSSNGLGVRGEVGRGRRPGRPTTARGGNPVDHEFSTLLDLNRLRIFTCVPEHLTARGTYRWQPP